MNDCALLNNTILPALEFNGTIKGNCCNDPHITCEKNRITELYLNGSALTGTIPPEISKLSALKKLNLSDNMSLQPAELPNLANLTNLMELTLFDTNIKGEFPGWVTKLPNLYLIDLSNNSLEGTIPDLGSMSQLQYFYIGTNYFVDSFPTWFPKLSNMLEISMDYNQIYGEPFPAISSLTNLQFFSASSCNLTGIVTPDVGNLVNLEFFYLDNNDFYGSIPSEISKLVNLYVLDFSFNHFDTDIPTPVTQMPNYQYFSFNNQTSIKTPDSPKILGLKPAYLYIIAVIICLAIFIGGFLFYRNRKKEKVNQIELTKIEADIVQSHVVRTEFSQDEIEVSPRR
ncbi:hypothetical protein HDV06_002990 [Boothiomyces sp. JEL0866]|nr:hypothetical protein HDV06_000386 [Boothiomyces sp. JEL0866]KAJ3322447.1 hypothetical protein HDV06_002990 [Boothiomyces sp. JEL0866]